LRYVGQECGVDRRGETTDVRAGWLGVIVCVYQIW
jgi:hypothetical protein